MSQAVGQSRDTRTFNRLFVLEIYKIKTVPNGL